MALVLHSTPGCDGDSSTSKTKPGEDSSKLQGSVDELLEQVKKGGAQKSSPEEMEKIASFLDKAAVASEKGKATEVSKNLRLAEKALKSIAAEQEKVQEAAKALEPLKTAAEDAKKQADAQRAAQNAPETYQRGLDALAKAKEAAAKRTPASLPQAQSHYTRAEESFQEAAQSAKENELARLEAEEEKKAMLVQKAKATEKDAEHKAAVEWNLAGQNERQADRQLSRGDFASARETFKVTQSQYAEALQALLRSEEEASRNKPVADSQLAAQQPEPSTLQTPPGEPNSTQASTPEPAVTVQQPVKAAVPTSTASINFPENFDPAAPYLKQELDSEDEEFLLMNFAKLCPSGRLEYDHFSAAASIDYTVGDDVQKDVTFPDPTMKKTHVLFKTPAAPGAKPLDAAQRRQQSAFSFQGNTKGMILFPIPFRFYCRVDFFMQVHVMDQANNFSVLVMNTPGKGGYMTDWCRTGTTTALSSKGIPPAFLKSSNDWFDKLHQKPMLVQYVLTTPKTGTLTNVYNNEEGASELEDKLTVKLSTAQYSRGKVGFKWNRVKFSVIGLRITGLLDKQAAVDMLRTKLKVKKSTPSKGKTEDKSQPSDKEKAGDNPAAPPSEGEGETDGGETIKKSADASKKPGPGEKGGFDF